LTATTSAATARPPGTGAAPAPGHAAGSADRPATLRILVAEQIAPEGVDALRARHEVDVRTGLSAEELRSLIPEYDALVVRSQVDVDAALIAAASRLQVIGRAGVGVDNVDLDAATRAGITVVNAPTGNTIAAAEHTIALLLALARRVPAADASMRRGEWARGPLQGVQLRGRTLGIVGLGKIGMAVAERARGLGMTLLGSDPYVTADQAQLRGVELVDFNELLERSDAVTVHVPLSRATTGLIGARAIARMKAGAFVLNVARGGIVDEPALAEALREGRLGGAGIDVFEAEPPTGSPLLDAPNTVLTPHLGASTLEAQIAVAEEIAEQVLDVLAGRPAQYAVNAPLLTPEEEQTIGPFLPLAEKLGRFLAQFARSGVGTFTVELAGELAKAESSPLTAAALRGLLERVTTERVNLVNAGILAKSRGLSVVERRTADAGGFSAAITVSGSVRGGTVAVGGTLAGGEHRLVRLNEYRLDMAAEDLMLITRHQDRPGTIGRIGQLLGQADVNISAMHLARSAPRADALMVLSVDDDVPPELEAAIRADDGVLDLWTIRLGPHR
jgi:D-3-phosphoglycerate dehydrogenase